MEDLAPVFLADKSALARFGDRQVAEQLGPLLVEGLIATCPIIDLEVLYSARSLTDYEQILEERRAFPSFALSEAVTDRAFAMQRELAKRSHRRVSIPALLIAAVAETNDLTVLHYDADYELIASVTGLLERWIVPRGSV